MTDFLIFLSSLRHNRVSQKKTLLKIPLEPDSFLNVDFRFTLLFLVSAETIRLRHGIQMYGVTSKSAESLKKQKWCVCLEGKVFISKLNKRTCRFNNSSKHWTVMSLPKGLPYLYYTTKIYRVYKLFYCDKTPPPQWASSFTSFLDHT